MRLDVSCHRPAVSGQDKWFTAYSLLFPEKPSCAGFIAVELVGGGEEEEERRLDAEGVEVVETRGF